MSDEQGARSALTKYLSEVRERESRATAGPWFDKLIDGGYDSYPMALVTDGKTGYGDDTICDVDTDKTAYKQNATFIAHARIDVTRLRSMLERAVEALDVALEANWSCECPTQEECAKEQDTWRCTHCKLQDAYADLERLAGSGEKGEG